MSVSLAGLSTEQLEAALGKPGGLENISDAQLETALNEEVPELEFSDDIDKYQTTSKTPVTAGVRARSLLSGLSEGQRNVVDMMTSPLSLAAGVINRGVELGGEALGFEMGRAGYPTTSQIFGFDSIGQRAIPRGQDTVSDRMYTGGSWLSPGAGKLGVNVATKLDDAITNSGGLLTGLKRFLTPRTEQLSDAPTLSNASKVFRDMVAPKSMRPDVYAATGAVAGEQIEQSLRGDNDDGYYGLAELIGGLLGGMRGAAVTRNRGSGLTKTERRALGITDDYMADLDKSMETLQRKLARREVGTLTDLTEDQGVADLTQFMRYRPETGPNFRQEADKVTTNRRGQVEETIFEPFGKEDAQLAESFAGDQIASSKQRVSDKAQATRARIRGIRDRIASEVADTLAVDRGTLLMSQTMLDQAIRNIDPKITPVSASVELSNAIDAADVVLHAKVRKAWEGIKDAPDMDTKDLKPLIKKFKQSLTDTGWLDFNDKYKKFKRNISRIAERGTAPPIEIQDQLSDMKALVYKAAKDGDTTRAEVRLGELADSLDAWLDKKVGADFAEAKRVTIERSQQTKQPDVKKAMLGHPELTAKKLGLTGEKGAVTGRLVDNISDPAVKDKLLQVIKAQAADEIARKGELSEKFIKDRKDLLSFFPFDVRDELTRLSESSIRIKKQAKDLIKKEKEAEKSLRDIPVRARQVLKKSRARETGRLSALDKAPLGQYVKDTGKFIRKLLIEDTAQSKQDLVALKDEFKQGGVLDAFNAAIRDQLYDISRSVTDGAMSEAAKGNVEKAAKKLLGAGVITKEHHDDIIAGLSRLRTEKLKNAGVRGAVGLDVSEMEEIVATTMSTGFVSDTLSSSQQLMVNGMIRRAVKNQLLKHKYNKKVIGQVEEFLLNPESYFIAARKKQTARQAAKSILTKMFGATKAAELLSDTDWVKDSLGFGDEGQE